MMDARGDPRAASAGHILFSRLLLRGAAGLVSDGGDPRQPRDRRDGLPVFAAAASPA